MMMTIEEIQRRRQNLLAKMADNSIAIIFAAEEKNRSADTEYPYRQDSDFWYLTGFNEPEAALILIKEQDKKSRVILFNRYRDKTAEIWYGRRLGQEKAITSLALDEAYPFAEIDEQLPLLLNNRQVVYFAYKSYDYADCIIGRAWQRLKSGARQNLQLPVNWSDWRPLVHEMRLIKSTEEITIMRQAAEINMAAHRRAMLQCRPGKYEYQLEAEIQYEYALRGARYPAYNTIVGAGENGCILHYVENSAQMKENQLVLIDAGCELAGYASDITRTFPVNGRFTVEQRAIYDIVLAAQYKALELLVPGNSIAAANQQVIHIMVEGLVKLGILQGDVSQLIADKAWFNYYMHGLGHWLGLDVHDVGDYQGADRNRILQPGMVLTVEPGLYLSAHNDIDSRWHNIGIRIEDNIVITKDGNELLTGTLPKEADEIEALMAGNNN